jgi:hypothetical protein
MRKLCLVLGVILLPLPASAQYSWSLPAIGLPPSPRSPAPQTEWRQHTPWDQMKPPAWERRQTPPWEGHRPNGPRRGVDDGRRDSRIVYVPYYAFAYAPPPQVIVVQQPVERIVRVEVPVAVPEPRVEEPPKQDTPPPAPYVPTGDRTVYVIPGCYVGNVSPVNLKLPDGCDITKLTTYVP